MTSRPPSTGKREEYGNKGQRILSITIRNDLVRVALLRPVDGNFLSTVLAFFHDAEARPSEPSSLRRRRSPFLTRGTSDAVVNIHGIKMPAQEP
jgi:hypothetical protein